MSRALLSIHGIRTEGEWQNAFREVFEPHFRFAPFWYGEFRHSVFALVWLALEFVVLILTAITGLVLARLNYLTDIRSWAFFLLFGVLAFLAGRAVAEDRRNRVVARFHHHYDHSRKYGPPPHVVAHSLGTFVVARFLLCHTNIEVAHIVFMGCVLNPRLDWTQLAGRMGPLRNEVAGRDWVAALASYLRPLIPEFGSAGRNGFETGHEFVKTMPKGGHGHPWTNCKTRCQCGFGDVEKPSAKVLNVSSERLDHNDMPRARTRARDQWLPFFWGLPPSLHREFLDGCIHCAEQERLGKLTDLNLAVAAMRGRCWHWTRGSLDGWVRQRLLDRFGEEAAEGVVVLTIRNLYQVVAKACEHDAPASALSSLYPDYALNEAANVTRDVLSARR